MNSFQPFTLNLQASCLCSSTIPKFILSGDCAAPGQIAAQWDFTYDGDGTLVAQLYTPYIDGQPQIGIITTYFMGGAYEVTTDANGATLSTKKYYSIAGMTVAMNDGSGLQYLLTDHLGSVVAVTDSTGTLTNQQRYLPFGQVRADLNGPRITQTDFGYTGQRANSYIKLDDFRARWLDPELGRFIQPDSIVPNPANPQSLNRYSYVLNRPINLNDPTGHDPWWCESATCEAQAPGPGGSGNSTNSDSGLGGTTCGATLSCDDSSDSIGSTSSSAGNQTSGSSGSRGGRNSGLSGNLNTQNPPASADPTLMGVPMGTNQNGPNCPSAYTYVQCFYSGQYVQLNGATNIDAQQFFQLLLGIYYDLNNRAPVGGYDFATRQEYDTPFWDAYGTLGGAACVSGTCYKRSEMNYVAQGMWVAASGQSEQEGATGVWAWKTCNTLMLCRRPISANYSPQPSSGTLYWFDYGYRTYFALKASYP